MTKRIALFMDGTWDKKAERTNVWRMAGAVAPVGADGRGQVSRYFAGVGTRIGEVALGGLFGWGLDRNVREAYADLVEHYEPGDHIFLVGFSRGAFTARSLAGMITKCGLLNQANEADVARLWRYYVDSKTRRYQEIIFDLEHHGRVPVGEEAWLIAHCAQRPIDVIAVWETVGALGIPFGDVPGISRRAFRFHNTRPSRFYGKVFQALAIDELRIDFAPTYLTRFLTRTDPPTEPDNKNPFIEQRWFIGAHSNVGGGIKGNRLSDIPLRWMMERVQEQGLTMTAIPTLSGDELRDPVDRSLYEFMLGLYRLLRPGARKVRTMGSPPRELVSRDGTKGIGIVPNETIDPTVFDRWRAKEDYRPPALVDWAKRRGVDPATLFGTFQA